MITTDTDAETSCQPPRGGSWPAWAALRAVALIVPAALLTLHSAGNHPGHDFLPIYAAAERLRAGGDPYDVPALVRLERPLNATDPDLYRPTEFVPYYYPPWLALACVPLTALGYRAATGVWVYLAYQALVLAAYGLRRLPRPPAPILVVLALLAVPSIHGAHLGQTSALVLLLLVVAWRLLEGESDGWAGLALAGLSVKPHMTLVTMAAVLAWSARRGRWKVLWGFAITLSALGIGSALLVPGWPVGMLRAPRLTPLPSMTDPSYGVTWFLVLKTLGLAGGSLLAAYAALALPAAVLAVRADGARASRAMDVFALGSVAAFFVSPHSLAYDFTILVFPMMVFLRGLSDRRAAALLLCLMIGFNVHYSLIQGGTTGTNLGALFWLPAGLALVGLARAERAGALRRGPSGGRPSWRRRRSCAGGSSVAPGSRAGA